MVDVFLVHRYRLLAEAIVGSLAANGKVSCIGSADNRLAAMEQLRGLETGVVLVDASLGRREVCDTIREIKAVLPDLNVLFLGDEREEDLVDYIEAGASGYVPREASLEEMLDTIEAVDRGQTPCSPRVAASVLARIEELVGQRPERSAHKLDRAVQLTPRESEVLRLVAAGLRNKEIASQLGIKLPTVKNHVHKILDKFQVKRRREAIRMAFENGLLEDPLPRPSFSGLEG
ncbi:MAG: response regulator transcription factor [bacterium]|nr:response regulator transcription factor [bacterium]